MDNPGAGSGRGPEGKSRSRGGFTLLEVMAAVAIVSIVLMAVYKLHLQTISMNTAARFYTVAPVLAQRVIADFELNEDEMGTSGDFGDAFPGYLWSADIGDVESELLGETAERLKRLDVTVSWNDDYHYSVRTYRFVGAPKGMSGKSDMGGTSGKTGKTGTTGKSEKK